MVLVVVVVVVFPQVVVVVVFHQTLRQVGRSSQVPSLEDYIKYSVDVFSDLIFFCFPSLLY